MLGARRGAVVACAVVLLAATFVLCQLGAANAWGSDPVQPVEEVVEEAEQPAAAVEQEGVTVAEQVPKDVCDQPLAAGEDDGAASSGTSDAQDAGEPAALSEASEPDEPTAVADDEPTAVADAQPSVTLTQGERGSDGLVVWEARLNTSELASVDPSAGMRLQLDTPWGQSGVYFIDYEEARRPRLTLSGDSVALVEGTDYTLTWQGSSDRAQRLVVTFNDTEAVRALAGVSDVTVSFATQDDGRPTVYSWLDHSVEAAFSCNGTSASDKVSYAVEQGRMVEESGEATWDASFDWSSAGGEEGETGAWVVTWTVKVNQTEGLYLNYGLVDVAGLPVHVAAVLCDGGVLVEGSARYSVATEQGTVVWDASFAEVTDEDALSGATSAGVLVGDDGAVHFAVPTSGLLDGEGFCRAAVTLTFKAAYRSLGTEGHQALGIETSATAGSAEGAVDFGTVSDEVAVVNGLGQGVQAKLDLSIEGGARTETGIVVWDLRVNTASVPSGTSVSQLSLSVSTTWQTGFRLVDYRAAYRPTVTLVERDESGEEYLGAQLVEGRDYTLSWGPTGNSVKNTFTLTFKNTAAVRALLGSNDVVIDFATQDNGTFNQWYQYAVSAWLSLDNQWVSLSYGEDLEVGEEREDPKVDVDDDADEDGDGEDDGEDGEDEDGDGDGEDEDNEDGEDEDVPTVTPTTPTPPATPTTPTTPSEPSEELPAARPDDVPADKPEDVPSDKPEDRPDDKPEDRPADKPEDKPDDVPADKPADKPDEEPEEEPDTTPTPLTTKSLKVSATWSDGAEGHDAVRVSLYRCLEGSSEATLLETVSLDASNEWSYTWTDLPATTADEAGAASFRFTRSSTLAAGEGEGQAVAQTTDEAVAYRYFVMQVGRVSGYVTSYGATVEALTVADGTTVLASPAKEGTTTDYVAYIINAAGATLPASGAGWLNGNALGSAGLALFALVVVGGGVGLVRGARRSPTDDHIC